VAWRPFRNGPALALVSAAVILAGCGQGGATVASTSTSTTGTSTTGGRPAVVRPLDVVNAPVKVADTTAGPVGYREVGAGSPVLLVMGLGGSMDDWQPAFVATLATDHYPGAGHAFLFQDSATFLPAVERFLS